MGAYFFNNCELGPIICEEDLNTLKHSATTGNELHFSLEKYEQKLIHYTNEFFRYLYQKAPFTLRLKKLKFDIKLDIKNNEMLYLLLLNIEKNLNKYVVAKKFNFQSNTALNIHKKSSKNNSGSGYDNYYDNDNYSNSYSNDGQDSYSSSTSHNTNQNVSKDIINNQVLTLIKITFNDLLYRIKQIIPVHNFSQCSSLMNYFGLMALSNKSYDNKFLCSFYLNINRNEYDHLLPLSLSCGNVNQFITSTEKFICKHSLTNIKLPPIIISKGNQNEEIENISDENLNLSENLNDHFPSNQYTSNRAYSKLILNKIIALVKKSTSLRFFDLSFVIYVDSISDICIKMKYVINQFQFKYNDKSDFILRFYLLSGPRLNLYRNLTHCEKEFKKSIANLPNKVNSYIMMYIFKDEIVKCDVSPQQNPYYLDQILDNELNIKEKDYEKQQKGHKWLNRNIEEENINESYSSIYRPILMTKELFKIYSNTEFEISWFLRAVNAKNSILLKLKKKTIISVISRFLSINLKKEFIQPKHKKSIYQKVYECQIENIIPMVKWPKNEKEIHSDIIHCHFDQMYNLLQDRSNN